MEDVTNIYHLYETKEKFFCHGLGRNFVCSNVGKKSSDLIKEFPGRCSLDFGFVCLFCFLFLL